jgi:hypothetical protein
MKEVFMLKKFTVVLVIVVLFCATPLVAKEASVFDIGIINAYRITDIAALDYQAYVPSLRLQAYVAPWFGIAVGGTYDYLAYTDSVHRVYVSTDAVVRAPLGMFEPYLAIGPVFLLKFPNTVDPTPVAAYTYHARLGFDVYLNDWLAIGLEGDLLLPDVKNFVSSIAGATIDGTYFMDNVVAGIAIKAKF